eukprot:CAMPEP_0183537988 /NCGR_PEP_ID=MMETSP0371-20130417/29285_1 /TAXON_ID=268820 /ORGANISM="Peridinium aciculiferum, Strain PAER-2" /LENGTH=51 /DNA_ID=CAMNT_0025738765 /DNA_START=74 /DNA_END=226 /DNA_ORIENTATION=-
MSRSTAPTCPQLAFHSTPHAAPEWVIRLSGLCGAARVPARRHMCMRQHESM